jgi:hypothetical protein
MTAAIARLFPRASAISVANIDTFITVALFSGVGLLLSLTVFDSRSVHPRRMVLN